MVTIKVDIDSKKTLRKVRSDSFGLFLAQQWKRIIDPYTPRNTGTMQNGNVQIRPWEIEYNSRYAHYMYKGIVYVDPVYHFSGLYSEKIGWWSRPGVKKVPSGRTFNYGKVNPYSTDHWDQKAAEAGQGNKLAQTAQAALDAGKF